MTVDIEKYIRRALEQCMRGAAGEKAEVNEFNSILLSRPVKTFFS